MGAAQETGIRGAKGGDSSAKTPVEASDSLRSTNLAKILIAVGEGEFEGTPTNKDIYLDNTPIEDASGNLNLPNVNWTWRTGSVEQGYIPGIPAVENESTINVELTASSPWVRSLTNLQLSAARVRLAWPALQKQDDEGNVGGYRIEYAIDVATDGGAYQQVLIEAVDGKTTTRYERSRRIDLPPATSGWQIRVRRITPNQNTNKIADTMLVAGLSEVIDAKIRYPNTALLYIEFDAEQFSNIPAVTVKCKARKWPVPSNYDPVSRTYSGAWDGTFKEAWTNNPAWITYGICVNDRFGLGKRIKPWMVDKYELFRIAQYCDQMVPDGASGTEPRFLCDMNLQGKADAWSLLRDIAGIYRGMTYWAQGSLVMQADIPRSQDFDYIFTRANVINGDINVSGSRADSHYSRALISYDNPQNNYDTDVVPVTDAALQRRYRDRPVEISAIGCTRASEAMRRGKWILLTNNLDRTVTFKTGMEGRIPLPGYVIPVADKLTAGREIGGRISSVSGNTITLDRDTSAKAGDRLMLNLPNGMAEGRTIQSVAGRAVTVTTAYSQAPANQLAWALDADDLAVPLYRVLSVKRSTEGEYEISAVQYNSSKFAAIDTGAKLDEIPISVIPITVVPAPASVSLTSTSAIDQGIAITTMTITWPAVSGAVAYDVEWRKDNGNWIKVQRTGTTSIEVRGIYSGAYLARVRAVSAFDISSIWRTSILTQLNGKTGTPPSVTSLTTESLLFGIKITWAFPPGAEDTQRTEIWYGPANDLAAATKLADLAYPQSDYSMQQLKAGATLFFWARLVDRSGNIGPYYPVVNGVVGQASSDPTAILEQIVGQITESQLGQELLSDIEKIDGDGPGSVNERIDEVKTALQLEVDAVDQSVTDVRSELQAQIDSIADLADSMPYKPDQTYVSGQGVLGDDGVIYQATKNVPVETPPPNSEFWLNVGQAVATANGLAARVQTIETKVTSVEGVNTAQASQITGLQTSLDGKAESSVVQSIGSRVTTAEGTLTSHGTAITGLTNALPGKANASTVQALTNTVTQQGVDITAQGQALTSIAANIGNVGGENLLYNPSFDRLQEGSTAAPDGWVFSVPAGTAWSSQQVASTLDPSGKAQRVNVASLTSSTYVDVTPAVEKRPGSSAGQVITLSVYVRGTSGLGFQLFMQHRSAAGVVLATTSQSITSLYDGWQRVTLTSAPLPADVIDTAVLLRTRSNGSVVTGFSELDRAQLEISSVPSGWKDNNGTTDARVTANAVATTALTARVVQTETGITSNSADIVTLNNNLTNAGGDNLLPNSSFEQQATDGVRPLFWRTDSSAGATPAITFVESPLPSSINAARLTRAGLASGGYISLTFNDSDGARPKVVAGQSYTLSIYARLSSPSARLAMYMQFLNSSSGIISTFQLPETQVGTDFARYSFTAVAPVGAVKVQVFPARLINRSGATVDMWIEMDNVQLQEGSVATAYSPSVTQGDLAQSAATAALTSSVSQQGAQITSVSGQVTSLSNSVNSTVDGLATKASSTALANLTSRVTAAEGINTSQSTSIVDLNNSVGDIRSTLGASGLDPADGALWNFDSNSEGWTGLNTTLSFPSPGVMRQTATASDPSITRTGLTIEGSLYSRVRVSITRRGGAASTDWDGRLFYSTAGGHGITSSYMKVLPNPNLAIGATTILEFDMAALTAGGTDWVTSTITGLRLDLGIVSGSMFDIDWIAVGRVSPGASSRALSSLSSTVTQQGAALTAESTRIDGLYTSVATTNAAVQSEATARTNGDSALATRVDGVQSTAGTASANAQTALTATTNTNNAINVSYSVKLMTTSNGTKVAAGFGLGLGNESGITQSQFVVSADRFAVLNSSLTGTVTSPFAVEGGQVFIADAFIKRATITNALVGQGINSATLTNYGQPVMTSDYNSGQIIINNKTVQGSYMILRQDGLFMVSSGVVMLELTL